MASKQKHIELSDGFFNLAEKLLASDNYFEIATSAELILVSLDHLVDAHLAYLGDWEVGRKERHTRFTREVLLDDTYIIILTRSRHLRDDLLYARTGTIYTAKSAKKEIEELIKNVRTYRNLIKTEIL